jgi:hypothetical protein
MTYRTFDGTAQTETVTDGRYSSSGDQTLVNADKIKFTHPTIGDFEIYQSGGHTNIYEKGPGALKILSDSTSFRNATNNADIAHFDATGDGACKLYENNQIRFETVDGGAKVTGTFAITGLPASASGLSAGDLWHDSGTVKIVT